MNSKAQRVNPDLEIGAYIRGTEQGNFFLVVSDTEDGIVGFRPLSTSRPALGSSPQAGVLTRVRVVPKDQNGSDDLDEAMGSYGFTRKNGGEVHVHYSQVTTDPATAIKNAKLALRLAA